MMTMTEMNDPRVWERRCGKGPPGACPRWRHIESSIVGDRGEGSDDDDNSSDEEMGDIESVPLTEEEAQRCRPQRASAETESPRNELFRKIQCRSRNHGLVALFSLILIIAVVSTVFATAHPSQTPLEVGDGIVPPEDQIMIGTRMAMEQAKFMIQFNEEMVRTSGTPP